MKSVLVLQHTKYVPLGYLDEIMQKHSISCEVLNVEEEPIPDPTKYNALITLGGPQHLNEDDKYPYFIQERAIIRHAIVHDVPYLGICLGGQLLAQVLGALVTRHHMVEFGFFEAQFTNDGKKDPLFQGLPGYQIVFQWHADTFDIPKGAICLATSDNTVNQAFGFGRRAYGLQYHIELTSNTVERWVRNFNELITESAGPHAIEILNRNWAKYYPVYRNHTLIMFENFLKISDLL